MIPCTQETEYQKYHILLIWKLILSVGTRGADWLMVWVVETLMGGGKGPHILRIRINSRTTLVYNKLYHHIFSECIIASLRCRICFLPKRAQRDHKETKNNQTSKPNQIKPTIHSAKQPTKQTKSHSQIKHPLGLS